jgi:hypothetical protein
MQAIPILTLNDGTEIESLFYDQGRNAVLIGLSDGRILKMDYAASTGFLTGERSVFVKAADGFGNWSHTSWSNIFFGIKDKIMEVASSKAVSRWKTVVKPFSADSPSRIVATFLSPVMWAGEDLSFWKRIDWDQQVLAGTSVKIKVRVADTAEALLQKDWTVFSVGTGVPAGSESMDGFNGNGSYLQVGVEMETELSGVTSQMSKIAVLYETKHAVYFFTTKFVLDRDSNTQTGLITGKMTVPEKTEVKFGVAGTNSADWAEYTVVELDKMFAVPEEARRRVKVGVKFVSYSDTAYAVVDEFAVALGADVDNQINRS